MILKAKHHFFLYPFFKVYTLWKIGRNFREVRISGQIDDKGLPVLLLSNHLSWWDGFWAAYLNQKVFKRKFHFMILEEQLRKYGFFNKIGGYSVRKNSRTVIESINYTCSLLEKPENIVLLFPQGEIESLYTSKIQFEKGIERILKEIKNDIHIVFQVNLVDYFSFAKPTLFLYFEEYQNQGMSVDELQQSYNAFFQRCIKENLSKH
jgi:1-acyl-sn-glycerol-3-phosphate acyltransferase